MEPAPVIGFGEPATTVQFAVGPSVGVDSTTNPAAPAGHPTVTVLPVLEIAVSPGCTATPSVTRTLSTATISFHQVVKARNWMTN